MPRPTLAPDSPAALALRAATYEANVVRNRLAIRAAAADLAALADRFEQAVETSERSQVVDDEGSFTPMSPVAFGRTDTAAISQRLRQIATIVDETSELVREHDRLPFLAYMADQLRKGKSA